MRGHGFEYRDDGQQTKNGWGCAAFARRFGTKQLRQLSCMACPQRGTHGSPPTRTAQGLRDPQQ